MYPLSTIKYCTQNIPLYQKADLSVKTKKYLTHQNQLKQFQ